MVDSTKPDDAGNSDRELLLLARSDIRDIKDSLRSLDADIDKVLSRQYGSEEKTEALQSLLRDRLDRSDESMKVFYADMKTSMLDSVGDARATRGQATDALADVWLWFKKWGVWLLLGAAAAERFGILKFPT